MKPKISISLHETGERDVNKVDPKTGFREIEIRTILGQVDALDHFISKKGARLSHVVHGKKPPYYLHILYCACFIEDLDKRKQVLNWMLKEERYHALKDDGILIEHIKAALGECLITEKEPGLSDCLGFTPYDYLILSGFDFLDNPTKINLTRKITSGFYCGVNIAWLLADIESKQLSKQLALGSLKDDEIIDFNVCPEDKNNLWCGTTLGWQLVRADSQLENFRILNELRKKNKKSPPIHLNATPSNKNCIEYRITFLESLGLSPNIEIIRTRFKILKELLIEYPDQFISLRVYPEHPDCLNRGLTLARFFTIYLYDTRFECCFINIASSFDANGWNILLNSMHSNVAYVRAQNGLFYINKSEKTYVQIELEKEKLQLLDQATLAMPLPEKLLTKMAPITGYTEILSQEQLAEITSITGHHGYDQNSPYQLFNLLLNRDVKALIPPEQKGIEQYPYQNDELENKLTYVSCPTHYPKPVQRVELGTMVNPHKEWTENFTGTLLTLLIMHNEWEILKNILARDYYNRKIPCFCSNQSMKAAQLCSCEEKEFYTKLKIDINAKIPLYNLHILERQKWTSPSQDPTTTLIARLIYNKQFGILDYLLTHFHAHDIKINLNARCNSDTVTIQEALNKMIAGRGKEAEAAEKMLNKIVTFNSKTPTVQKNKKVEEKKSSKVPVPLEPVKLKPSPEDILLDALEKLGIKKTCKKEDEIVFSGDKNTILKLYQVIGLYKKNFKNFNFIKLTFISKNESGQSECRLQGKQTILNDLLNNNKLLSDILSKVNVKKTIEISNVSSSTQPTLPSPSLPTLISLTEIQQKDWISLIRNAFCRTQEMSIDWNEEKNCFICVLPANHIFTLQAYSAKRTLQAYSAKRKEQEIYHIEDDFIEKEIVSRFPKEIAVISFDKEANQMSVTPKVAHLLPELRNQLYADISNAIQNKLECVGKRKEDKQEIEDDENKIECDEESIIQDALDDRLSLEHVMDTKIDVFNRIKTFLQAIAPPDTSLGFLDVKNMQRKKRTKWELSYTYSGAKQIGTTDSIVFFEKMANVVGKDVMRIFYDNKTDKVMLTFFNQRLHEYLFPEFTDPIKKQFLDELLSSHSQDENCQALMLVSELKRASERKTHTITTPSTNHMKAGISQFRLNANQFINLRYHMERFRSIQAPDVSSNDGIHYAAFSLHIFQIFRIFSRDSDCYALRNALRHRFRNITWDALYNQLQPFISAVTIAIPKAITYRNRFLSEDAILIQLEGVDIPSILSGVQSHTASNIKQQDEIVLCKKTLEGLVHSEIDHDLKRDATLQLYSWLGELEESDNQFRSIYRSLGHAHNKQNFEELANTLYAKITSVGLFRKTRAALTMQQSRNML